MSISQAEVTSVAANANTTDAEVIALVRSGHVDAYGALYERHYPAARRFARSVLHNDADTDDVVAEVFTAILSTLERGKGPVDSFAPYLFASIRHECQRLGRRRRRESTDRFGNVGIVDRQAVTDDPLARLDDAAIVQVAFDSLPAHLRELLWHIEVTHETPTALAERSGATPRAVMMSALRARRALGDAYLQQHLPGERHSELGGAECGEARRHLAKYVRGALGMRRRRRIESHLERCPRCSTARDGLGRMNQHLRVVPLLPLNLGSVASTMLSVRDHIVAWWSTMSLPLATSGVVVMSVFGPAAHEPPPPASSALDVVRRSVVAAVTTAPAPIPADPLGAGSSQHIGELTLGDFPLDPSSDLLTPAGGSSEPLVTTTLAPIADAPPNAVYPEMPALTTVAASQSSDFAAPANSVHPESAPPAQDNRPNETVRERSSGVVGNAATTGTPPSQATNTSQATNNGTIGTPPSQATNNANANANPGTPPGQANANANPGTPPGQATNNATTGTPPSQATNNANPGTPPGQATNNANPGTPPGQATNNGNANIGTPPGQATNNANANPGTPPSQATNNANANPGTPPSQATNNANANIGTPPSQATNNANAGTPPSQATNNANAGTPPSQATANANIGTPPSQATNNANANANIGTPPSQATDNGNGSDATTPVEPSALTSLTLPG